MKLHDKLTLQATETARQLGLPDTAIPQLTNALLCGATVAMEHISLVKAEDTIKAFSPPQKRELVCVSDDDL